MPAAFGELSFGPTHAVADLFPLKHCGGGANDGCELVGGRFDSQRPRQGVDLDLSFQAEVHEVQPKPHVAAEPVHVTDDDVSNSAAIDVSDEPPACLALREGYITTDSLGFLVNLDRGELCPLDVFANV